MRILLLLGMLVLPNLAFGVNLNCSLATPKKFLRLETLTLDKAETRTNVDDHNAKLVYVATVYIPSFEGVATVVLNLEDRVSGQQATQWFDVDLSKPQTPHTAYRLMMKDKKGRRADFVCDVESKTQKKGEDNSPPSR